MFHGFVTMKLTINTEKAEFNESKFGSKKLCVVVTFPNCYSKTTGNQFKWMPTYKQLEEIKEALEEIEKTSWEE